MYESVTGKRYAIYHIRTSCVEPDLCETTGYEKTCRGDLITLLMHAQASSLTGHN